jgi:hypothetical protein
VIVVVGVNGEGRPEVRGMDIGPPEAETFLIEFLRKFVPARYARGQARDLRCPRRHHGGGRQDLDATWQRCCACIMRNALAHAARQGRRVVSAFIGAAFVQDDADAASKQRRAVTDQLRPEVPLSWTRRRPRADLHELSEGSPAENPGHQSVGACQRRDQATHGPRRHLPQRGRDRVVIGALLLEVGGTARPHVDTLGSLELVDRI